MRDYAQPMIRMTILTKKLYDAFLRNKRQDAVLISSDIVDIAQELEDLAIELGKEKIH